MPENTVTGDPNTSKVRAGLRVALDWLDAHPQIPITHVDYIDGAEAELTSPAGQFTALRCAADAAEALPGAKVTVSSPCSGRHLCQVSVSGAVPTQHRAPGDPFLLTVSACCFDQGATALLSSLGATEVPGEPSWTTTGDHLRSLVPAGDQR